MTRTLIILLIFTFNLLACFANNSGNKDTLAVIALNEEAWDLRKTDPENSKKKAFNAVVFAKKINYQKGISKSYNIIGNYYKTKGRYDSAIYYFQRSFIIRSALKDSVEMAKSYRNIMSIYKMQGDNKQALQTGILALNLLLPLTTNASALKEKAWLLNNMAAIYLKTGDYNTATKNALQSHTIFNTLNDNEGLAAAVITLGNVNDMLKNYPKALLHYQNAIALLNLTGNKKELAKAYNNTGNIYYHTRQYNEARTAYRQSVLLREKFGFTDDLTGSYYNLGVLYEAFDKKDSALDYYNKSLKLSEESGNVEFQYETYSSLGALLSEQKKFAEAIRCLKKSLSLTKRSGAIPETLLLFKEIASAFKGNNEKDSALVYSELYAQLNDSLNDVLRNAITLNSEIKEKEHDLKMSLASNTFQKFIIICLFILITLLVVILILIYRSYKAKKGLLRLREIIKEQELKTLDALLEGQESERKRLALELHDTIGSILSATKYAFKSMEKSLETLLTENKNNYQKINQMLDEALENVRRISHDMASGILVEKGIGGALQQLCSTIEATGNIQINLNTHGFDEKIDYAIEVNLYRIIQELLTNVIKHSSAKQVNIQLIKSKKNINLVIDDDGKGFNPSDPSSIKGIGLSNINQRVKKLSGKWNIDSGKGKGTTTVIDVPLND